MKVTEQIVLSKSNVALGVEGSLSLIKDLKLSLEYGLSRMQQDQRRSEINYAFALSKWVCAFGKPTALIYRTCSHAKCVEKETFLSQRILHVDEVETAIISTRPAHDPP